MSEEKLALEFYKKYVDGLLSNSDLPDFIKSFQKKADREYKSFIYFTVQYHDREYHFQNGEVEIGGHCYRLRDRVDISPVSKYGYIVVNNEKIKINHSGLTYSQLSDGAKYKVNRTIGRAMAYVESKKLSSQISHFAQKTNSTNPPYDEFYDEIFYRKSDDNYRISSFKKYVKDYFDQQADINFGHNSLNLYGLSKLIEYKSNIVSCIKQDKYFYDDVFDDVTLDSQQQLNIMTQNSEILKKTIFESANILNIDVEKVGRLSQMSEETAKGYLNQISLVVSDPMFVKSIGEKELQSIGQNSNNYKSYEEDVEDTNNEVYFTQDEYTVRQDSHGVWRLTATNEEYNGIVYSEDRCPVSEPDEDEFLFQHYPKNNKSAELDDDDVLVKTKK